MSWWRREAAGEPDASAGGDLAFDEAFLRRLERMSLRLKRVSEGVGGRPGSRRMPAADFIDHRPYSPGDDQRHIDWNAAARHEEVFVKVGRVLQSADLQLLLDASPSMAASARKWRSARQLAAALSWMSLARGDRVSLHIFPDGQDAAPAAPRRGTAPGREILRQLAGLEPRASEATELAPCLERIARGRRGGLVVVISDLWLVDDLDRALARLPAPRWELMLLQLLDPAELRPDLDGPVELIDSESGQSLRLQVDADLRRAYRRQLLAGLEAVRASALRRGASHALLPADWPIEQAVIPYLQRRALLEA